MHIHELESVADEKIALETIIYERIGGVSIVRLNRPERMNALSQAMKSDLRTALFEIARNDSSRCIVITGEGDRAFCAGADLKERAKKHSVPSEYYVQQQDTYGLFSGIADFEKPIIAAINGYALGGGLELAMCCDLLVVAENAKLGLPEVKVGLMPAAGGTQRLTKLIGALRAKQLILLGEHWTAAQAHSAGLANYVAAKGEALPMALALAEQISAFSPLAVRFAKRSVNLGMEVGQETGMQFERYAAAMLVDTEDRREGIKAFIEKRKPKFKGK